MVLKGVLNNGLQNSLNAYSSEWIQCIGEVKGWMLRCPAVAVVAVVVVAMVVVVVAIWDRPVSVINPSWGRSSGRIKTRPKVGITGSRSSVDISALEQSDPGRFLTPRPGISTNRVTAHSSENGQIATSRKEKENNNNFCQK